MFIKRDRHWLLGLTMTFCMALVSAPLSAQQLEQTSTWQQDQEVDLSMQTLHGPVWQPIWFTPQDRIGMPAIPLYKQQPGGAQGDFRPPPPEPESKPGPTPVGPGPKPGPGPGPETKPEPEEKPGPPPKCDQNGEPPGCIS